MGGAAFASDSTFVFVKIPESIMPLERAERYEDPINDALQSAELGEVSGGGTMLSAPKPDGTKDILWVGVDVDLYELNQGLELLKSRLIDLNAPMQTIIEIHLEEGISELVLVDSAWVPKKQED